MTFTTANLSAACAAGVSLQSPRFEHWSFETNDEEKPVKQDNISLPRRYLMLAAVAGVGAPASVFAAQNMTAPRAEPLIVSGRIVDLAGAPLAGALIEVADVKTRSDGDGRFVLMTAAGIHDGCPQTLDCRIVHSAQRVAKKLEFARTRVLRDETGTWRAGVSLNISWRV